MLLRVRKGSWNLENGVSSTSLRNPWDIPGRAALQYGGKEASEGNGHDVYAGTRARGTGQVASAPARKRSCCSAADLLRYAHPREIDSKRGGLRSVRARDAQEQSIAKKRGGFRNLRFLCRLDRL